MDWFDFEREKYWASPSTWTKEKRKMIVGDMVESGDYVVSEKIDGNWCAFIKIGDRVEMQTRGRSTVTGKFGRVEDKVPEIFKLLCKMFDGMDVVVLGELYYKGGNDKDVGSILRCKAEKAIARQKDHPLKYYIFDVWCYQASLMKVNFEERIKILNEIEDKIFECNAGKFIETAAYYDCKDTYDILNDVLENDGEGVVLQRRDGIPEPGKRPARKSMKIKKEIQQELDVVCIGTEEATKDYTGIAVEFWNYWQDIKTGEKLHGNYYIEYIEGKLNIEPITKSWYYGWPGSIRCGVYKDNEIIEVCSVSGLTDELKIDLTENPDKYYLKPLRISGMEITAPKKGKQSVRHPRFIGFRDDIDAKDCTYDKVFGDIE